MLTNKKGYRSFLPKGKKAGGDMSWMVAIIFILIGTSLFLEFTTDLTDLPTTSRDIDQLRNQSAEAVVSEQDSSIFDAIIMPVAMIGTIIKIATWQFGFDYFILSIFFDVLLIILILLIYRQIRSGGG